MSVNSANSDYHSYLLRLWRDGPNHPWRAALHCSATGEKFAFADLLTLFAFLLEQVATGENGEELVHLVDRLQAQIADNPKL